MEYDYVIEWKIRGNFIETVSGVANEDEAEQQLEQNLRDNPDFTFTPDDMEIIKIEKKESE